MSASLSTDSAKVYELAAAHLVALLGLDLLAGGLVR